MLRVSSESSANVLKSVAHRARPGRTTVYFGTFLLLAACVPTDRTALLAVPFFIALGRVVGSPHYLSDVRAGAAGAGSLTSLGLSVAYFVDRPLWRSPLPTALEAGANYPRITCFYHPAFHCQYLPPGRRQETRG